MTSKLQDRGINLNTLLIILSIITAGITVSRLAGPIFDTPEKTEKLTQQVGEMQRSQAVQNETLRSFTDAVRDYRDLRRDVDRQGNTIEGHGNRLDRLEQK